MIKGEVNLNGVGYYLDDTSGIMVTNEWKKLKSINSGRNRYGFYASSGYLKNDSDIEGCYEGYSVFSHGVFSRPIETVVYYINTPANTSVDHSKVRIEIKKALENITENIGVKFSETTSLGSNNISLIFSYANLDTNVLASTRFFQYYENELVRWHPTIDNSPDCWPMTQICINYSEADSNSWQVYAHELGHCFGLSHHQGIKTKPSIMYCYYNEISENGWEAQDRETYLHLYD